MEHTYAHHTIASPVDLLDTHTLPAPVGIFVPPPLDWMSLPVYLGGISKPASDVLS